MQTAKVIPFRFDAREVRTLLIDDQPWFVAADVCQALSVRNNRDALSRLDDDEKGVATTDTLGGAQDLGIINESGLYSLILTSRKAEAKRFKKWVTAEVLPAIRKHGRYEDHGQMRTLIGQTIGTDGFHCLGAVLDGKLRHLPAPTRRRAKQHVWSQVHKAFSVVSAQDIPASQLDSARNFIAAYALEGEWLGKEPAPASELNEEDLASLYVLCADSMELIAIGEKMQPALQALNSITLMNVPNCLDNCRLMVGKLNERFGAAMESAARKHKVHLHWINLQAARDRSQPIHIA